MSKYTFGFIGAGNMGGALARAAAKKLDPAKIIIADNSAERAAALSGELGCAAGDNTAAALECRYIFLGLKPQVMAAALDAIAPLIAGREDRFVLVTMAAGLSIETIRSMAHGDYPVIRIMPNTPASIGEGMILHCASENVTREEIDEFCAFMAGAGRLDALEEKLIDAGCALSGCGPAFVYMFIEALADGGVECGLPRAKAMEYAAQTLLGSAKIVLESGKHPGELKDAVCSPGGSTIVGVHALESSGFRCAAMDAVCEAYEKSVSLGKSK